MNHDNCYQQMHNAAEAPQRMAMDDRLGGLNEAMVVQTTELSFCWTFPWIGSMMGVSCCFMPSINRVVLDSSDQEHRGTTHGLLSENGNNSAFELPNAVGWIHEESNLFQRYCCNYANGCRETKFVHHAGLPPESLGKEDYHHCCCVPQTTPYSPFLKDSERHANIVAVHEKTNTCPTICCCLAPPGGLPYLRTTDGEGRYMGETRYVRDGICIPKFLVLDKDRNPKYLLKPASHTFCLGPYLIWDPVTEEPIRPFRTQTTTISNNSRIVFQTANADDNAKIEETWLGMRSNTLFCRRHAYQVAFPESYTGPSVSLPSLGRSSCSVEDKLVLIGASILVDMALHEMKNDPAYGI